MANQRPMCPILTAATAPKAAPSPLISAAQGAMSQVSLSVVECVGDRCALFASDPAAGVGLCAHLLNAISMARLANVIDAELNGEPEPDDESTPPANA